MVSQFKRIFKIILGMYFFLPLYSSLKNFGIISECKLSLALRSFSGSFISFGHNVVEDDFTISTQLSEDKDLINIELRKKSMTEHSSSFSIMNFIPKLIEKKPVIAKTGYRPNSSISTSNLDEILREEFNETQSNLPIAIFVYMWVDPEFRGNGFGDYLLQRVIKQCIERKDKYMIIVHDDNGSGRLIEYYKKRNFYPIFHFLDKGMICKLPLSIE